MNGIVVIPAFDRPAFLKLCIEHIINADQADTMRYIFTLDNGFHAENLNVLKDFPFEHAVVQRKTRIIGIGKQSNNVLMGLLDGLIHGEGKPIYYVEDDVFIGKDFFTFGAKILENEPDAICAILSHNVNAKDNTTDNVNAYYTKYSNEYQGIGSIFNPAVFEKYIRPHICQEYILNPQGYCRQFKSTTLGDAFCEQDGLIRRIIEANKLKVCYSHVPRCFHAGFFGYHRMTAGHIKRLPIDRQVERIRQIAFNVSELSKIAQAENLVYDSMPVNLQTQHEQCQKIELT